MRKYFCGILILYMTVLNIPGLAMDEAGQAGETPDPVLSAAQHRIQIGT